eukprot:9367324-Ditylum_brightwellii.AAC.1
MLKITTALSRKIVSNSRDLRPSDSDNPLEANGAKGSKCLSKVAAAVLLHPQQLEAVTTMAKQFYFVTIQRTVQLC